VSKVDTGQLLNQIYRQLGVRVNALQIPDMIAIVVKLLPVT
jgi:hypothetical protein